MGNCSTEAHAQITGRELCFSLTGSDVIFPAQYSCLLFLKVLRTETQL